MTPAKRIEDACTVSSRYGGARMKESTVVVIPFHSLATTLQIDRPGRTNWPAIVDHCRNTYLHV
jgi:hypothetical protein